MKARAPTADTVLRADAAKNRRALVNAAHQVFGRRGLDAPLDEIARRAEVGNATLYRHFPSRCSLVAAVFTDTLTNIVAAANLALSEADPWSGFAEHVEYLCRLQATDRALADLLTTALPAAPELEALRLRAEDAVTRLIDRAKSAGALRADFQPEDLILLLMANAGLLRRTAESAPHAWKRLVRYTLDGLRASSATTTTGPCGDAIRRAMDDQATQLGCNKTPSRRTP